MEDGETSLNQQEKREKMFLREGGCRVNEAFKRSVCV